MVDWNGHASNGGVTTVGRLRIPEILSCVRQLQLLYRSGFNVNLWIALFRRTRWHFPQVVDPVYEFLNARKYGWYLLPANAIKGLAAC